MSGLEDAARVGLRKCLDHNHDGLITRARALKQLRRHGELPVRDPEQGGDMVADVSVEYDADKRADYLKRITWITARDCPECGYDRADHTHERYYDIESVERWVCRACGHEIEQNSTV